MYRIRIKGTERILFSNLKVTHSFWDRFMGLMGKREVTGDGLFLKNVSSIHTCFMRFPIGVIYLDKEFRVLVREQVTPWRMGRLVRGTTHVIEVKAGDELRFPVGEILELTGEEGGLC